MDQGGKDVSEFVRLTEPHHKQLYGIAIALCRDPDKAADLVQEALIRAFEAFDRFRRDEPVLPWIRRILRNVYLDSFKTGRYRHEVPESELGPTHKPADLAVSAPDPLAKLEQDQLFTWVREEMTCLDPTHQQVLELCVMQELSFVEAAEIAEIPVGTLASRLARARVQLRKRVLRRVARVQRQEGKLMDVKDVPGRTSSGQLRASRDQAGPFMKAKEKP